MFKYYLLWYIAIFVILSLALYINNFFFPLKRGNELIYKHIFNEKRRYKNRWGGKTVLSVRELIHWDMLCLLFTNRGLRAKGPRYYFVFRTSPDYRSQRKNISASDLPLFFPIYRPGKLFAVFPLPVKVEKRESAGAPYPFSYSSPSQPFWIQSVRRVLFPQVTMQLCICHCNQS